MFESIRVRNFRILDDLEIGQLSRINLIAGRNGSGKTSLLEAVFLLAGAGNPHLAVNANVIRINRRSDARSDEQISLVEVEGLWKALFSNLEISRAIEVTGDYAPLGRLTLKVSSGRPRSTEIPLGSLGEGAVTNMPDERSLTFRYARPEDVDVEGHIRMKGKEFEVHIKEQGFDVEQPVANVPFSASLLRSWTLNVQEDAVQLAQLRREKRGHVLLEALRVVEPSLQSIEDNSAGGSPMIWGDVGLSELVPLPVMGEGMTRIARLVLAISSTQDGVVLVDEIENGLHHSILPKVWEAVDKAARQFNAQIFATTHSLECVRAAHEALGPDGFGLHRLEVIDSKSRCVTYDPQSIDSAVLHSMEVR